MKALEKYKLITKYFPLYNGKIFHRDTAHHRSVLPTNMYFRSNLKIICHVWPVLVGTVTTIINLKFKGWRYISIVLPEQGGSLFHQMFVILLLKPGHTPVET